MWHERCGHECVVELGWYERYTEGAHGCPGCGDDAELGDALQFAGDAADPVLDDQFATEATWYHSSTRRNWPSPIDFTADLTQETLERMGGKDSVARWACRQGDKALHVGTYESAIHNMLRRIDDQGDEGRQFYLYAVRLRMDVTFLPGSTKDPSNWLGDVWLDEIAPPEVDAVRYVNVHEDPGGVSVAVRPKAISSTRCLPIPLEPPGGGLWVAEAEARLRSASTELVPLPAELSDSRFLHRETYRAKVAWQLVTELAAEMPASMQSQFESAVRWVDGSDPAKWVNYARIDKYWTPRSL